VSLLDFVKEQRAFVSPGERSRKQAYVANTRAEQKTDCVLSLELGHIESEEPIIAKEVAGELDSQFGLAYTRGTKKQKAATGAPKR
jgi:hypothetical protein